MVVTMNVNVIVDELVLHGVEAKDRFRVGAAVREELLLIGRRDVLNVVRKRDVDADVSATISRNLKHECVTRQIGRAVARTVSR